MRSAVKLVLVVLLTVLGIFLGRAWLERPSSLTPEGEITRAFDVAVMNVATVRLVAGTPDGGAGRADVTAQAVAGLGARLAAEGFGPAMRRGTQPRATVDVLHASTQAGEPDCTLHLSLTHFELADWSPPTPQRPGRASFFVEGRVWVSLAVDAPIREFFGDFTGHHDVSFGTADVEGAPAVPELAAARLFGRRFLETMQRGLVWRTPSEPIR